MTATALLIIADAELRGEVARQLTARGFGVITVSGADTIRDAESLLSGAPPQVAVIEVSDERMNRWLCARVAALGRARLLVLSRQWPPPPSLRALVRERDEAIVLRHPPRLTELIEQLNRLLSVGVSSVPPAAPELRDELARARASYGRRLPSLVSDVARALSLARGGDLAAASQAQSLAHRLGGTAGSYGFVPLAEALAALDGALERLLGEEGTGDGAWRDADTALAAAMRALDTPDIPDTLDGTTSGITALDPQPPRHRLLVLDDDVDFLRYVAAVGRRHAVEVLTARTPVQALERARDATPDAALLDVHLGEESSFTLTRQLRSLPRCSALPLAFVSSDTRPHTRAQAAYAGGSTFVKKPLDEPGFAALLATLFDAADRERPRLLVVDDDPAFNSYVSVVLQRAGMLTQTLDDPARILEALERLQPDLVLLDVAMTGLSGFDVCRLVRTAPEWRHLIIVFVTAQGSARSRANAFAAGADDFLVKPIVDEELIAHARVHVDNQRLRRSSTERDTVTGLPTRAGFVAAARQRLSSSGGLALVALDDFDALDSYGLTAGERVIGEVGRLVAARFSRHELRCRWSDGTFALVFTGSPEDGAGPDAELVSALPALIDRLRAEIAALRFVADDGRPFGVRASTGIAYCPADGTTLERLVETATAHLVRAGGDGGEPTRARRGDDSRGRGAHGARRSA